MVRIPKYTDPVPELPCMYDKTHYSVRMIVRARYEELQGGLCCHCGEGLNEESGEIGKKIDTRNFPKTFYKHPVHLHHDHDTGLTIGAVHAHCNAVLWQYYGE